MKTYSQERATKLFKKKGFKLVGKYTGSRYKSKCIHIKCGKVVNIFLGKAYCHYCDKKPKISFVRSKKEFKKLCKENKVIFVKYKGCNNKCWRCPKCNKEYVSNPSIVGMCGRCLEKRDSYNALKECCKKNGDTLITSFKEFKKVSDKILVLYGKCKHLGTPKGSNYKNNPSCNICARKKVGKQKRIPLKYIKRNCKIAGVKLVSSFISTGYSGYYVGKCLNCGRKVIVASCKDELPRCTYCNPITISEPKVEYNLRKWLSRVTGYDWKKVRPKWLPSTENTGCYLELDMYCKELKLAIEYNGPHHYLENTGVYGLTKEEILKIIKHDNAKKHICKTKNIKLLVIDGRDNSYKNAKRKTKKWLRELNIIT